MRKRATLATPTDCTNRRTIIPYYAAQVGIGSIDSRGKRGGRSRSGRAPREVALNEPTRRTLRTRSRGADAREPTRAARRPDHPRDRGSVRSPDRPGSETILCRPPSAGSGTPFVSAHESAGGPVWPRSVREARKSAWLSGSDQRRDRLAVGDARPGAPVGWHDMDLDEASLSQAAGVVFRRERSRDACRPAIL